MILYRGRRALEVSNQHLTVTVTREGGHIARILHHDTGVNPLWSPPWPTIEPSSYDPALHSQYGSGAEAQLLAGILGHNLCLDLFGPPSPAEAAAGLTVHGEASVGIYDLSVSGNTLSQQLFLPGADLFFTRHLELLTDIVRITETVENRNCYDRPSAWTQHVTLGPPFIERGVTQFRAPATRSKVFETDFAQGKGFQVIAAEFDWPFCPRTGGGVLDLRVFESAPVSAGFTTHLLDPDREQAFFLAWNPNSQLLFGYVWSRADFPWLGRWEENCARHSPPWSGNTIALGMEFGASPMPEPRRAMIERGGLFGAPGYRWLPARQSVTVTYCAFARRSTSLPEAVSWDGASTLHFH